MTDAPERIWAFHAPDIEQDNLGCTIVAGEKAMPFSTEYIRADLSADLVRAGYLAGLGAAANQCASMANEMDWCDENGDSPFYIANDCCDAIRALPTYPESIAAILAGVTEKK